MAELDNVRRAKLPDSAFAYVDSKGRRRLPINDESHVRNALARFNQVRFEDEAARERSRKRLLTAAKRYGIVPVGFFAGQLRVHGNQATAGRLLLELGQVGSLEVLQERLRSELRDPTVEAVEWSESIGGYLGLDGGPAVMPAGGSGRAVTLIDRRGRPMIALVHDPATLRDPELRRSVTSAVRMAVENRQLQATVDADARDARSLPPGPVTFLMTDIEDSTGILQRLGDEYGRLLTEIRGIQRTAVRQLGGHEIDARADEYFAVFELAADALKAAVAIQRRTGGRSWPDGVDVRLRIGLHHGKPTLTDTGYVGIAVHTAARVCAAGHGGQILVSRAAHDALTADDIARPRRPKTRYRPLGSYLLQGLRRPDPLFQVEATGLATDFPGLRSPRVDEAETTDRPV
ncbi:MAG: adenylate/guanylate cyclase domain-containing protein [Candidatus Limnocylindrales bacterium]